MALFRRPTVDQMPVGSVKAANGKVSNCIYIGNPKYTQKRFCTNTALTDTFASNEV